MSPTPRTPAAPPIVYPERDGKPMADNTLQFQWIATIEGNLEALFRDNKQVFVAGDNLWYPVEGEPEVRQAPDVYVVFGRPKGHRGSYQQWLEGGIPLTVVFEILSPGNTAKEMADKLAFYDYYEVEEYYVYDPDTGKFTAYQRGRAALARVYTKKKSHTSPRLNIRFDLSGDEMAIYYPDGRRFLTFEELEADRAREREGRLAAEKQARVANRRADQATLEADQARQQADQARLQSARLAELSRKARQGQATAADLAELERLEASLAPP